jgi:hypothetical protein
LSPEASWKNVDSAGLRIARLAYVMHYSLGTQAHMMRTRRLTARTPMRALGKSLRRAPTPCDNHLQRESFSASSAPKCSTTTRNTMDCDPCNERMAANSTRASGPNRMQMAFSRFLARIRPWIRPGSSAIGVIFGTWIRLCGVWLCSSWIQSVSDLDPDEIITIFGPGPTWIRPGSSTIGVLFGTWIRPCRV